MTLDSIKQIIKENGSGTYTIVTNGKKEKKRLFVSHQGNVCELLPHKRHEGVHIDYLYDLDDWSEMIPTDYTKEFMKVLQNVIKYLGESGMNNNLKSESEKILALGYDVINNVIRIERDGDWPTKEERRTKLLADNGIKDCKFYSFILMANKGIKNINFEKRDKEAMVVAIGNTIITKGTCNLDWYKGYHNYVSVYTTISNEFVGYYSENMVNEHGHNYYLLDETHALYKESN